MLSISSVDFHYNGESILSDLNLQVKQGDFIFIIGKSGVGKSTLLQLIYMNLVPSSGTVQFGKYDSKTIKPSQLPLLRRKLGIIFQDFKLLKDRTIFENVAFVLESITTPSAEIKKKVLYALDDVGLSHKRNFLPRQLSGGEQQRVAIARAIVNDPVLILADEPTGNLDPDTTYEIINILKRVNERGTSVLIATHNYDIVKKYQARIIKLENGKAYKAVIKQKP
jgi:cell division transport system ATP-binding protein